MVLAADKETQVHSEDYGRDLSSVQTLLTKQETFDAGLQAFDKEGIQTITALKDQLIASKHAQTPAIEKRYNDVIARCIILFISFLISFSVRNGRTNHFTMAIEL